MRSLLLLVGFASLVQAQDTRDASPIAIARQSLSRAVEAARYLQRAEAHEHLPVWDQAYEQRMTELMPATEVRACRAVFRRASCTQRERCAAALAPHFVLQERRRLQSATEPLTSRWDDLVALRVIADRARDTEGSCRGQPSPFDEDARRRIGRRAASGRDALEIARNGVPTMEISTPQIDEPNPRRPAQPHRDEIGRVMRARTEAVASCMSDPGVVVAQMTFSSDGRVRAARIGGSVAGTPVAQCIEEKLRSIRIMPFERAEFRVSYPFRR